MGITPQQVEEACNNIEKHLALFRAQNNDVSALQRCLAGLNYLREQYRSDKGTLAPYVGRIKELSRQVRETVAAARESLTARYLEAVGAVAAWEDIREACRDALLELAEAENAPRLDSAAGWIEVKRASSISLPRAGTPQREELLALITQAGQWPQVAFPHAARLLKAMNAGAFTPQQVGQLTRLCPPQTFARLVAHVNGA